jgi:hypothetical protein
MPRERSVLCEGEYRAGIWKCMWGWHFGKRAGYGFTSSGVHRYLLRFNTTSEGGALDNGTSLVLTRSNCCAPTSKSCLLGSSRGGIIASCASCIAGWFDIACMHDLQPSTHTRIHTNRAAKETCSPNTLYYTLSLTTGRPSGPHNQTVPCIPSVGEMGTLLVHHRHFFTMRQTAIFTHLCSRDMVAVSCKFVKLYKCSCI